MMFSLSNKTLIRLGEDLRKAGFLMNVGFVGMIVNNDVISLIEGLALLIWGFYCWSFGHYLLYLSEIRSEHNSKGDDQ